MFHSLRIGRLASLALCFCLVLCLLSGGTHFALAQSNSVLLELLFDGNLVGEQGQRPVLSSGVSFTTGIHNQGALLSNGNQLTYTAAGNINPREGTFECWVQPRWNGNDNQGHLLLTMGGGGGILLGKDGANNLRCIFNRYSINGLPEFGIAINIGNWVANQWHHVAYAWSNASHALMLYVDGVLQAQTSLNQNLPSVSSTTFQIGGEGTGNSWNGVLDELRISSSPRTGAEIAAHFLSGVTISSLTIAPTPLTLLETWQRTPTLTANTNFGVLTIPPASATWISSNQGVATVTSVGRVTALHAGTATITATVNGFPANLALTVNAPVLSPTIGTMDPFLRTPAKGYLYEMPVAIICYLPTRDGVNLDSTIAGETVSLAALKQRIDQFNIEAKFMLEEGSRFRGYKTPGAYPSLGYRVVQIITVYEEMPPDLDHSTGSAGVYFPDYNQILARFQANHLVSDLNVREFWIWGYHFGNIAPVESNMSSPTTGDISNSFRFQDDLPIFDRTYMLYNYNFSRSSNEAVHNHGHQLEAILSYVNQAQNGNTNLFWHQFVGQNSSNQFITGRSGWTHMPPNTTSDYDYENLTLVSSDIEDWTPNRTGATKLVNANTWGTIPYAWPYGRVPAGIREHQWYMYWMQNMPGRGNVIGPTTLRMNNWWDFKGDWDAAVGRVNANWGLYTVPTGGGHISGNLRLEGLIPSAVPQSVTFRFQPFAGGTPVIVTVGVGPNGAFDITELPRENYTLHIKSARWLAKTLALDLRSNDATNLALVLKAGDANNDNAVDIGDLLLLIAHYNQVSPASGYLDAVDFNTDGANDIADLLLLIGNYNQLGDS